MKIIFAFFTTLLLASSAFAAPTQITWYGHAAFGIKTPKGKVILIDPWLKNPLDPLAKDGKDPIEAVGKVDYILVTHGHSDHTGDAAEIGKKTGARLVTNFELGDAIAKVLGYPAKQMGYDSLMNIGGEVPIADGEVTVVMTPAVHSSGVAYPNDDSKPAAYGGNPSGFVLKIAGGPTIYHSGDTAYFSDMSLIGRYSPDLALLNIGGHFGMLPEAAARAAVAVHAKLVVPHHFKTFPILTQDAGPFFKMLDAQHIAHYEMKPGETITFEGKTKK